LEVNLVVLLVSWGIAGGEATRSDDKLLTVDEAEDNDDSENGQGWNVEEDGG
jgi:hypothetical protein